MQTTLIPPETAVAPPVEGKPPPAAEYESLRLTPGNAEFSRSPGGLISLKLEDGTAYERVVMFRCFPVTNADEFISVREPDSKKMGRGQEIGMIRRVSEFPAEIRALIDEELSRRYFSPEITRIISVKDRFGYTYWDVETSSSNISFVLNNPFSNIRLLEDGRLFISDLDGNVYQIPDLSKLDGQSMKFLEIYI